jgi:hypothetical protein
MDDLEICRDLDELFFEYVGFNHIVKDNFKLTDNDVRVSFYKLCYHVIDATIHLILFSKYGYSNSQILGSFYERSRIQNRMRRYQDKDKLLSEGYNNTNQFIAYSYFISIFNIFENSFRILSQFYDPKKYQDSIISIEWT